MRTLPERSNRGRLPVNDACLKMALITKANKAEGAEAKDSQS